MTISITISPPDQKCFDAAFLNTPGAAVHCGLRDMDVEHFRMQVAFIYSVTEPTQ